jgi:hypothetical protein
MNPESIRMLASSIASVTGPLEEQLAVALRERDEARSIVLEMVHEDDEAVKFYRNRWSVK